MAEVHSLMLWTSELILYVSPSQYLAILLQEFFREIDFLDCSTRDFRISIRFFVS